MFFWFFMLIMDLLIPFVMIYFGKQFMENPPEKINNLFGYRTTMSMKTRATWRFAHNYCGKLWHKTGKILLPLSVIPLLFVINKNTETIAIIGLVICFIQLVPLTISIIPTERALKNNFDQNGKPKN